MRLFWWRKKEPASDEADDEVVTITMTPRAGLVHEMFALGFSPDQIVWLQQQLEVTEARMQAETAQTPSAASRVTGVTSSPSATGPITCGNIGPIGPSYEWLQIAAGKLRNHARAGSVGMPCPSCNLDDPPRPWTTSRFRCARRAKSWQPSRPRG